MDSVNILYLPPHVSLKKEMSIVLQNMAEKTISATVVTGPQYSVTGNDWELEFDSEKYIMPLHRPQASREDTRIDLLQEVTFQHWAVYQLKRYLFFSVSSIESKVVSPDRYVCPISLNLEEFCFLLSKVLRYYYGDRITVDLNTGWSGKKNPSVVTISHSRIWDILVQMYEIYGVRWHIEPAGNNDNKVKGGERYIIKIGYESYGIEHVFRFGFTGGLRRLERQIQNEDIRNILIGRGGSKNLPARYFKNKDPQNPSFTADPDWIPELANVFMGELRGSIFRHYVQGWKTNPRRQLEYIDSDGVSQKLTLETYDPQRAETDYAYRSGHFDESFKSVEYVKDDVSISKYGPLMGGLDNNEDIYPTIQNRSLPEIGRIDEVVAVEKIESDNVVSSTESTARITNIEGARSSDKIPSGDQTAIRYFCGTFSVDPDTTGSIEVGAISISAKSLDYKRDLTDRMVLKSSLARAIGDNGIEVSAVGLQPGKYSLWIVVTVENSAEEDANVTVENPKTQLSSSSSDTKWTDTWNIWIKNIFSTSKKRNESAEEYSRRVWSPILGDSSGNKAKIVFSDGMLAVASGYEFILAAFPVYDERECSWDDHGETVTYRSHWRLQLNKSDVDLDSTGKYVPSTMRFAKPGDHFFFTEIELPHLYVTLAEDEVDNWKRDALAQTSEIPPVWSAQLDKVRVDNLMEDERQTLLSQIRPGVSLRISDHQLVLNDDDKETSSEILYIESVTFNFKEPSDKDPALTPDCEIVLSKEHVAFSTPVSLLDSKIDNLSLQIGSLSNLEQVIRSICDKVYLRKDGISDISVSPTEFGSLVTSRGFRKGMIGGKGWGNYIDADGRSVIEADVFKARNEFDVNTFVINQTEGRGGQEIWSSAVMEVTAVVKEDNGFRCFFDQKNGTVANMFQTGDIGYCQRYYPDNRSLKFYKRRVMATNADSILLTMGYPAVTIPGVVDSDIGVATGSGIPEKGDVIVAFGSYTKAERQYVGIRDVIGGGYIRFLSGLNHVGASGMEYFFAGLQSGVDESRPRVFIGDNGGFIDFSKGKLKVLADFDIRSTAGDTDLGTLVSNSKELISIREKQTEFETDISEIRQTADNISLKVSQTIENKNLLLGTADGSGWGNPFGLDIETTQGSAAFMFRRNSYILSPVTRIRQGENYVFHCRAETTETQAVVQIYLIHASSQIHLYTTVVNKGETLDIIRSFAIPDIFDENIQIKIDYQTSTGRTLKIWGIMLEQGNTAHQWTTAGSLLEAGVDIGNGLITLRADRTAIEGDLWLNGLLYKKKTEIDSTKVGEYLEPSLASLGVKMLDFKRIQSSFIELTGSNTDFGSIRMPEVLESMNKDEKDNVYGLNGAIVTIFNRTSGDLFLNNSNIEVVDETSGEVVATGSPTIFKSTGVTLYCVLGPQTPDNSVAQLKWIIYSRKNANGRDIFYYTLPN